MSVVLYPAAWNRAFETWSQAAAPLDDADRRAAQRALQDLPSAWSVEHYVDHEGVSSLVLMPEDDGTTYAIHLAGTGYDLAACEHDRLTELGRFSDVAAALHEVRQRCLRMQGSLQAQCDAVAPRVA